MPHSQAGTLSGQHAADGSGGQGESGGTHRHWRHTHQGPLLRSDLRSLAGLWAPVTRFPALSKKAKNSKFLCDISELL